jgi:hypothetical protein
VALPAEEQAAAADLAYRSGSSPAHSKVYCVYQLPGRPGSGTPS